MKIEPNKDIGMNAKTILIHKGILQFPDGQSLPHSELQKEGNAFATLCDNIDPNITYINVLIPNHADNEVYFEIIELGRTKGIHVQSVIKRTEDIWEIWKTLKK